MNIHRVNVKFSATQWPFIFRKQCTKNWNTSQHQCTESFNTFKRLLVLVQAASAMCDRNILERTINQSVGNISLRPYPDLHPCTALNIISLDWMSFLWPYPVLGTQSLPYPVVFMPAILIRGMSDLLACACYWLFAQLQLITSVHAQTIWQPDNNFSARIRRDFLSSVWSCYWGFSRHLRSFFLGVAGERRSGLSERCGQPRSDLDKCFWLTITG